MSMFTRFVRHTLYASFLFVIVQVVKRSEAPVAQDAYAFIDYVVHTHFDAQPLVRWISDIARAFGTLIGI